MVKKTYKAQGRPDCMILKPRAPACSVTQWGNASPAGSWGAPRCSLGWPSTMLGAAVLRYLLQLALSSASDQSLWWQSMSKLSPAPSDPVEVWRKHSSCWRESGPARWSGAISQRPPVSRADRRWQPPRGGAGCSRSAEACWKKTRGKRGAFGWTACSSWCPVKVWTSQRYCGCPQSKHQSKIALFNIHVFLTLFIPHRFALVGIQSD